MVCDIDGMTLAVVSGTTVATSIISADVLLAIEMSMFEFPSLLSSLEEVDMEGTKVAGAVENGMSNVTSIPLPSSVIIPAV